MHNTSNYAEFEVIDFFTGDMTSQSCPFPVIAIRLESIKIIMKKNTLCLKTSFLAQSYTSLCISLVFEQNKKIHMIKFSTRPTLKNKIEATPWVS